MDGALEALRKEFGGLRTGRASVEPAGPGAGQRLWQRHAAQPGRHRQRAGAAHDHGPGLGPRPGRRGREGDPRRRASASTRPADGTTVRVPIPELSQERRQELTKIAHKYAEQARVAVRNVRRDGMDFLKKQEKDDKISQDEHKKLARPDAEAHRRACEEGRRRPGVQGKGNPAGLM